MIAPLNLPPELAADLERKYFWWQPVGDAARSPERILAQAMRYAPFAEVRRLEDTIGRSILAEIMLGAAPGWFDPRSWEFWRGRLQNAASRPIADEPPVRTFDDADV